MSAVFVDHRKVMGIGVGVNAGDDSHVLVCHDGIGYSDSRKQLGWARAGRVGRQDGGRT